MHATTLRFLASHADVPTNGFIRGGVLMRWVDEAGYACACAWSGGDCCTAFLGNAVFDRRVQAGDLVEVQAQLAFTQGAHMGLAVEVRVSRVNGGPPSQVLACTAVYTALTPQGEPRAVDTWSPETPGDIALAQHVRAQIDAGRGLPMHGG